MVDGSEVIKFKNKTTMPIFIKKEMDDFKNIWVDKINFSPERLKL